MLVSIEEAKAAVPSLATQTDEQITRKIALATQAAEDYIHRRLEQTTKTDYLATFEDAYNDMYHVKHYPITDVASVTINGQAQTVATVTAATPLPLASNTVWRTPELDSAGKLYRPGGWPQEGFFLTYTGGYTSETLPEPIREALFKLLASKQASDAEDLEAEAGGRLKREKTVAGWEQERFQSTTERKTVIDGMITAEIAGLLRPYRWRGLIL